MRALIYVVNPTSFCVSKLMAARFCEAGQSIEICPRGESILRPTHCLIRTRICIIQRSKLADHKLRGDFSDHHTRPSYAPLPACTGANFIFKGGHRSKVTCPTKVVQSLMGENRDGPLYRSARVRAGGFS
jgi:hypothetical protein